MRFLIIFMALLFLALSTLLFIYAPLFFGLLFLVFVFCAIFWAYPKGTLLFFLIFMLLQGPIAQLTRLGIIFNLEELGILAMAFLVFAKRLVLKKPFYPMAIGKPLFMLLLIGTVSSIIYHIVPGIIAFGGAFLFLKGFMLYYIFLNVDITFKDIQNFKRWFYGIGILTVMYAILGIISWDIFLKPIGVRPSERFGIPALQSYLGHPGTFSALMGVLICFVVVDILIRKKMRHNLLFILFLTATIFSFRRTTLLGVILACIVVVFLKQIRRIIGNRTSLKMLSLVAGVCVLFSSIIFVSYKDLSSYVNQESPRSVLLKTGIKIATDFFPLGSGFGTYSGGINQKFYSPLFYKYRLSNVWGLSEDNPSFINDTFWPHIFAETGFIGLICYLWIILAFFQICFKALKNLKNKEESGFAIVTLMMLILSLVESSKATFYEMSLWTFFYFGSIAILQSWLSRNRLEKKADLSNGDINLYA